MTTKDTSRSAYIYGGWLLLAGLMGIVAAFELTLEKLQSLIDPTVSASCDFSVVVQCSANLSSSAGALFGFPNPLIGLLAWPIVLATAVLTLLGTRLPKFWWYGLFTGVTGALIFVTWLQFQSIMVLGTLCPWCMVTWLAVIPTWLATAWKLGSEGLFGRSMRSVAAALGRYLPLISLVWFFIIALWAQLRLDWIATL